MCARPVLARCTPRSARAPRGSRAWAAALLRRADCRRSAAALREASPCVRSVRARAPLRCRPDLSRQPRCCAVPWGREDYTEAMMEACRLGAKQAARLIETGELKVEALVRSCLERIAERDGELKAWTYLERSPSLAAARAPLFGVPVGVKDIFDTFDMPTAYGSPIYARHRPPNDAAAVALTRRAGGVMLGKTATTEFATFVPTITRNPHDPSRTPGGSSS